MFQDTSSSAPRRSQNPTNCSDPRTGTRWRLGWSNGDWNFSASISNLHRSGWGSYITDLDTDYYKSWSQASHAINVTFHRQLELTASYTFGYGKKIRRGDEIGCQGSAGSAILR